MNCKHIQSVLSAYIDGELPGDEMLAVRSHIHDCSVCSNELESCRKLKMLLSSLPHVEPDNYLEEKLLNCVHQIKIDRKKVIVGTASIAVLTAAAAFLAFAIFSLTNKSHIQLQNEIMSTRDGLINDQAYEQARNPFSVGIPVRFDR